MPGDDFAHCEVAEGERDTVNAEFETLTEGCAL